MGVVFDHPQLGWQNLEDTIVRQATLDRQVAIDTREADLTRASLDFQAEQIKLQAEGLAYAAGGAVTALVTALHVIPLLIIIIWVAKIYDAIVIALHYAFDVGLGPIDELLGSRDDPSVGPLEEWYDETALIKPAIDKIVDFFTWTR
jgi:hypothetical protein